MGTTQQHDSSRHRVFAAVYDRMGRPMGERWAGEARSRLLGGLTGEVLEIGAGTGRNLPCYRSAARVVAAEPAPAMRRRLEGKLDQAHVPIEVSGAEAEALPYADASFDAVVSTIVLCTVTDLDRALVEARRVLRPGGRLAFLEHVRSEGRLGSWQDRLAPVQVWCGVGCHPNRDTRAAMERAGFVIEEIELFRPEPNLPITSPFIQGVAVAPSPTRGGLGGRRGWADQSLGEEVTPR